MMLTVARRYCRDDHAAKDVLQEAFIRIFKFIPKYKTTGSFTAWLQRIVINAALQSRKKTSYKQEQTALEDIIPPMELDFISNQLTRKDKQPQSLTETSDQKSSTIIYALDKIKFIPTSNQTNK